MNKVLITEIFRLQELMGKSLIVEQWAAITDDVVKFIAKMAGGTSDEVAELVSKLKNVTTDEEALKIISQLVKSSDEIASYIIPKIIASMSDVERASINKVKTYLQKQIADKKITSEAAKKLGDNWVEKNVTTEFDAVKDIIKKEINNYVDEMFRKVDIPTPPKPKPKPSPETIIGNKSWDDIVPLTNVELYKLEKLYRQKGLGKSFFRAMRQFQQMIIDMMKEQSVLMDETLSLIKTLNSAGASHVGDIEKRIGENLTTISQKDEANFTIIDDWIEKNVLEFKIKQNLKSLPGYQKGAGIADKTAMIQWKKDYGNLLTRRKKMYGQLYEVLAPWRWFGDSMKKYGGSGWPSNFKNKWKNIFSDPEFLELRADILTGQSKSWKGTKEFYEKFGLPATIASASKEFVWSYLGFATLFSLLEFGSDWVGHFAEDSSLEKYSWFKSRIDSWKKHTSDDSDSVEKEKLNDTEKTLQGAGHLLGDISGYWWEEMKKLKMAFPGLLDNLILGYEKTRDEPISKETLKRLDDELKKDIPIVRQQLDSLEKKVDPIVDEKELDAFFVFLQKKYPSVGIKDKPYMKKDPNTPNTFTFEKCDNADCSQTKIETYTFNLTSGFTQKI